MNWTELRFYRSFAAKRPLAVACGLSLAIHLTCYGAYRFGKHLGWWEHQATWLLNVKKKLSPKPLPAALQQAAAQPAPRQIPLTFVEVDPAVAVTEAPKDAAFYSSQNSRASNPDPVQENTVPKIEGQQTHLVRTEDVPKPVPHPLQPAPSPPEKETPPEPAQPKPKASEAPGDLAKANEIRRPFDGLKDFGVAAAPAPHEKPRTLAAARQQKQTLVGEKMKQEGGTRQRGKPSLSVASTPFGSYDAALIARIQERWYDLLDNYRSFQRAGKVVVDFNLFYDGRISEPKVAENEVGEILSVLCYRAIRDPAPYQSWPSDMRRAIGKNFREVRITFFYD